ncbi:MAG: IPT/TIG domain-containing protein, partial [Steroidobacteraceae bacterium]
MASIQARADVQYVYDPAGRLVQLVAPDGSSAVYQYDAAGNILSITRLAAGQLALTTTSAISGTTGSQITIDGSGFSTTPSDDIVSFNGMEAAVVSATGNQLVVDVPDGATTGTISITVGTSTVTSAEPFSVSSPPSISGFSPEIVNAGATVTVSGDNLDPQPNATLVSVGAVGVQATSTSTDQVTFIASSSGSITISTPGGRATSTSDLVTLPTSVPVGSVLSSATLTEGGAAEQVTIGQSSSYGVYSFDGTAGQYLTIQVGSQVTSPSGESISYEVFSPTDALITSNTVSPTSPSIHLPVLTGSGTYAVVFFSSGSASVQLSANLQVDPVVSLNGVASPVTMLVPGENLRFEFAAIVGQSIGIGLTGLTLSPGSPNVLSTSLSGPSAWTISEPNCLTYTPGAGCSMYVANATQAGTYTLEVQAGAQQTGSFNLTASKPVA